MGKCILFHPVCGVDIEYSQVCREITRAVQNRKNLISSMK